MDHRAAPRSDGGELATGDWVDALLSTRGVWLFWLTYGVCFATIRYLASGNLTLDDAWENEMVQSFALGYETREPPLYEWILWSVQQVTGPGILSHLLVRYTLILAIGLGAFVTTRAITHDARWSAAASISYAFTGFVSWVLHEWMTQSTLASVACIASLYATIAFVHHPSALKAIGLGSAVGVGLMAKFNYPLYLGGLVLAVASLPEVRRRLIDPRLVLSGLVAAAWCAPYLWWLATVHGDVPRMAMHILVASEQPYIVRVLLGLERLAVSLVSFLIVWGILIAVLGWPAFYPLRNRRPSAPVPERIAGRSIVMAIALTAIGILAVGVSRFEGRYVYALLVTAPIYACARIARLAPEAGRLRRIVVTGVACAALLFAVRVVTFFDSSLPPLVSMYRALSEYREFTIPYDGLAAELRARGITRETLITVSEREAGNMRAYLPGLRVISDNSRLQLPPRPAGADRGCLLLWKEGESDHMRKWAQQDLGAAVRLSITTSTIWGTRHGVWYILQTDPRSPICSR